MDKETTGQPTATILSDETRRPGVRALFMTMVVVGIGQSLLFTILPPIARDFNLSEYQVTFIFSITALLWTISSPFWGRLSDERGRKPVMILGLVGYILSTGGVGLVLYLDEIAFLPVALMYPLLLFTRAMFGLLCPGTFTGAVGYIADRTDQNDRSAGLSKIMAAFLIGTVIGPGMASVMLVFDIYLPFVFCCVLALALLPALYLTLTEARRPHEFAATRTKTKIKLTDKRVREYLYISSAVGLLQAVILQVTGFFLLDVMHMDSQETAEYLSIGIMSMAICNIIAQLVIVPRFKVSVDWQINTGSIFMCIGFALFIFEPHLPVIMTAMACVGFGLGLVRTGSASGASLSVTAQEQGAVAGLISSTATIGIIFMPILIVPIYKIYDRAPYLACLVLLASVFYANYLVIKNRAKG